MSARTGLRKNPTTTHCEAAYLCDARPYLSRAVSLSLTISSTDARLSQTTVSELGGVRLSGRSDTAIAGSNLGLVELLYSSEQRSAQHTDSASSSPSKRTIWQPWKSARRPASLSWSAWRRWCCIQRVQSGQQRPLTRSRRRLRRVSSCHGA